MWIWKCTCNRKESRCKVLCWRSSNLDLPSLWGLLGICPASLRNLSIWFRTDKLCVLLIRMLILILVIHSWFPWCLVSKMQAYKNPKNYFHKVDQRQGQISPLNIYPSVPPWDLVQHANHAKKKKLNKPAFLGHLCELHWFTGTHISSKT